MLAVYSGTSLGDLSELASGIGSYQPLTFAAEAGTTYYVQAATTGSSWGDPVVRLTIEQPAPPTAAFYYPSFFNPSIYDDVYFYDTSYDPANVGFGPAQWDFGDGDGGDRVLPDPPLRRRRRLHGLADRDDARRADGDGHPGADGPHQRRVDRAHPGTQLGGRGPDQEHRRQGTWRAVRRDGAGPALRSRPGGSEELVGTTSGPVPQAHGGRSTGFDFTYTFTQDDRASGKVTFRAVAEIFGARDAVPGDNQAIAPPTEVRR